MSAETEPHFPIEGEGSAQPPTGNAVPASDQPTPNLADSTVAAGEAEQMLDVRLPHVHAPHDETFSWRGFLTHIAVVAIGLLLALGLEQGVEYIHHEFQRARLEAEMRETFQANIRRTDSDIRLLNDYRSYLTELKNAVGSRIAGGLAVPPKVSVPRNNPYAPPPVLGSYEASKTDGSVGLLGLNRIRLYDRIEFQHGLMLSRFQHFIDSYQELTAFVERFTSVEGPTLPQPNMAEMSPSQLLEYQALVAKTLNSARFYMAQLQGLKGSYGLMLRGVDDVDTLMDASISTIRANKSK